jgi:hypothetical protein
MLANLRQWVMKILSGILLTGVMAKMKRRILILARCFSFSDECSKKQTNFEIPDVREREDGERVAEISPF